MTRKIKSIYCEHDKTQLSIEGLSDPTHHLGACRWGGRENCGLTRRTCTLHDTMCYWLAYNVQWPDNLRPNIIELVTQSPVGKRGLIELQMKDICLYQQQGHPYSHTRRARWLYSIIFQSVSTIYNKDPHRQLLPLRRNMALWQWDGGGCLVAHWEEAGGNVRIGWWVLGWASYLYKYSGGRDWRSKECGTSADDDSKRVFQLARPIC